jgi:hypothetical protein
MHPIHVLSPGAGARLKIQRDLRRRLANGRRPPARPAS